MPDKRTLIAIAVVRHEGRILIARRPEGEALAGYWEFPGGKVRPGESPEEAARRECREELGCEVSVGALLDKVDHDYAHGALRLMFYEARLSGAPPATRHRREWKWVLPSELEAYRFPLANRGILAKLTAPVQKADG